MFYPSIATICRLCTALILRVRRMELNKAVAAKRAEALAHKEHLRAEAQVAKASKVIRNLEELFEQK